MKEYTFEDLLKDAKEFKEEKMCHDDMMFAGYKIVELTNRLSELEENLKKYEGNK